MIYINNLSISNDRQNLNVNITTNVGSNITKVLLWNQNTFKDYSQAVDLSFKLEQVNNNEIFIVNVSDINIGSFDGIWFLEFTTNYESEEECTTCQNTVIGIASNLNLIKTYLLDLILKLEGCKDCNEKVDNIIEVNLILESICTSLTLGYYEEAIFLYKKLIKLIGKFTECTSCKQLRTPTFLSTLNYGILNNTLILV